MDFVFTELMFQWTIIGIVASVTVFTIPRIAMITKTFSSKSQKKLQQLDNEYIEELEHKVKQYKAKANNIERGPAIEGNLSELGDLLPNVIGQFSDYAPKWLKPILAQPEAQKWVLEFAEKNPDKIGEIFGKLIRKKGSPKQEEGVIAGGGEGL